MAASLSSTRSESGKRCQQTFCDVEFSGNLHSELYGKLVVGVLKYFIFTRGQIPLQYDIWCRQINRGKAGSVDEIQEGNVFSRNAERKAEETANSIAKWIDKIEELFAEPETNQVEEILFILGATCLSPKMILSIKLPLKLSSKRNELSYMSTQQCFIQIFKKLVEVEETLKSSNVGITNGHLLVKMKNQCQNMWFIPKPEFEPVLRGVRICMTFKGMRDFNLGAFQVHNDFTHSENLVQIPSQCDFRQNCNAQDVNGFDDSKIWYQAPVTIKGIKNKNYISIDEA